METGLKIYEVEPLVEQLRFPQELIGSVAHAELLQRTNLVALICGGSNPLFPDNAVVLMKIDEDEPDFKKNLFCKIWFDQPVLSVRLRRDRIIIVLRNQVHIMSGLPSPELIIKFSTRDNPKGLCEVASSLSSPLLVFPGYKVGTLQLVDLNSELPEKSTTPNTFQAHEHELAVISLNQPGTYVATASTNGTLIRVFDVASKRQLVEFRRGADTAMLYCLTFSFDSAYLCSSSDKGTVHIFAVKNTNLNKRSSLQKTGVLGTYGESLWGLANFTVPAECACICAFGAGNNTVYAVCVDGTYHKFSFTTEGHSNREEYALFLTLENAKCDF